MDLNRHQRRGNTRNRTRRTKQRFRRTVNMVRPQRQTHCRRQNRGHISGRQGLTSKGPRSHQRRLFRRTPSTTIARVRTQRCRRTSLFRIQRLVRRLHRTASRCHPTRHRSQQVRVQHRRRQGSSRTSIRRNQRRHQRQRTIMDVRSYPNR